jgi:hypothetical protein
MTTSDSVSASRLWRIGVIASRHDMPVNEYLVERVQPGQSAYDTIYAAFSRWLQEHPTAGRAAGEPLYIYYSGLTEGTLAVADAMHNFGLRQAFLMRYDLALEDYEVLHRHLAACPLQEPTD